MAFQSDPSDKEPFSCLCGRGEEIVSFIGGAYLPSLPGSFEARAEKSSRSREAFGTPGRGAEKASGALPESLGRATKVARFFLEWKGLLPDLSGAYSFSRLEGGLVVLEAPPGSWAKRRKFDEAAIEEALNERLGGEKVKVKIVQNLKK